MDFQYTFKGQTAGGILRSACVIKMRAGNVEVVVKDRDGYEYVAIVGSTSNGHSFLGLSTHEGTRVCLWMSERAENKARILENKCSAAMLSGQ